MRTNLISMIRSTKTSIVALGVDQKAFDEVVGALPKEWQEYKTSYQFHAAYGQRESHGALLSMAGVASAQHELHLRSSHVAI